MRLRNSRSWSMFKLLTVMTYIVFMVLAVAYLVRSRNSESGSDSSFTLHSFLSSREIPKEVLDFEARVRPGMGENGKPVTLDKSEQTAEDIKDQMKAHSFNKYLSDLISLKRDLPDTRHQSCRRIDYDDPQSLPTVSVILIFSNEALSAVLRTVWSLILRSPRDMLKEIVLGEEDIMTFEILDEL